MNSIDVDAVRRRLADGVGGYGTLDVEGKQVELREGHAAFVPAGAEHRFSGYEQLSVLVIFQRKR